ncbi:MAG: response regulator [Rhodospirillales bacterium]|jgi:FixJ family two-component response regulator|nr:response regulator [Rhodospirillales bacterium]
MTKPLLIVVDDERAIGEVIGFVAEHVGVEIKVAGSAYEFQNLVVDHRPDVVFMDMVMPETSAAKLIAWMATNEVRAPVVLMSGYGEAEIAELRKSAEGGGGANFGLSHEALQSG